MAAATQAAAQAVRRPSLLLALKRGLRFGVALFLLSAATSRAQDLIAPGVWFFLGDSSKGYSNTVLIEMHDYLIVVDANYPGRAHELLALIPQLSPKPVRYVFDTHHHGDHSYGNSVWTHAGATTMAFSGVVAEMNRYEPARWQAAELKRQDLRDTGEHDVERPQKVLPGTRFVLRDTTREVDFLFLGWGHTRGDGYVWLPHERILATGDAAVNGPRNKLLDASIANWPRILTRAIALHPTHVLPGHGPVGSPEILSGQRQFLLDLYSAAPTRAPLPDRDRNWIPKDVTQDYETTANEIRAHQPAGSLPHEWK